MVLEDVDSTFDKDAVILQINNRIELEVIDGESKREIRRSKSIATSSPSLLSLSTKTAMVTIENAESSCEQMQKVNNKMDINKYTLSRCMGWTGIESNRIEWMNRWIMDGWKEVFAKYMWWYRLLTFDYLFEYIQSQQLAMIHRMRSSISGTVLNIRDLCSRRSISPPPLSLSFLSVASLYPSVRIEFIVMGNFPLPFGSIVYGK